MESQLLWYSAAGGLVVGLLLGYLVTRGASRREIGRVRDLEAQLSRAEADHSQYRNQVSQHFAETSRRLHGLTLQYKSVYEHLADGARSLCPEGSIVIAPSLVEAALPEQAGADPEVDANQLDLALEPSGWKEAARSDDLGPILDEETPPPPAERAS